MYYILMKRETLKQILTNVIDSEHTINSVLSGARRPSYKKILVLHDSYKIPFGAWVDIKSYLQENNTATHQNNASTKG